MLEEKDKSSSFLTFLSPPHFFTTFCFFFFTEFLSLVTHGVGVVLDPIKITRGVG
jgi:hypothetical protein